ncbi:MULTISPECIES: CPBP family intramembrane glutamic endopeptidase [Haloferax]|uniref:CPBP family intramembrane metalloprotease n=2 Tax=Haloferax TaxID=2251 RepID=A0A6G1Z1S6_9EURY|nr:MULTISPECIES: type II CAAX endopeptidase family protein [Haloferax]KAB1187932.1 CPBP family intramembrane metalloprotease [Haloferax sp. CBA1149]MRW80597.1 CPBP family intramembrane metalloprotease [Haloferax marinisediminis]
MVETAKVQPGVTTSFVTSPLAFFGVTYLITWSFWVAAIALGISFESAEGLVLLLAGLAGPGIAGIGFTYLVYDERGRKDYWRRLTDVSRIGLKWFAVILFLPLVMSLVGAAVDLFLGGTGATWSEGVLGFAVSPLAILPAVFFATLPPFIEELGWRGYVLDRLQMQWSALTASLILGVVWAVWHLPLFFVEGTYQAGLGVGTLEFWSFMIGVVGLTGVFTWVFNNTTRSILAIIILHGMVNFTGEIIALTPRADAIATVSWVVLVGVLAVVWGSQTLTSSDEVPQPPPVVERYHDSNR